MSEQQAILFTCGFICIYPIIGWAIIAYGINRARRIDWSNIKLPWRRS